MSVDEVIITDNYLSDEEFNIIQTATSLGSNFNWVHHNHNNENNSFFNHQFTHCVTYDGKWVTDRRDLFEPITNYLEAFALVRVKVNLLVATPQPVFGGFHIDCWRPDICKSAVLYLDDTNGPTEFMHGQKVDCVANRFVEFPASFDHASWSPTDKSYRRVINFCWIPR